MTRLAADDVPADAVLLYTVREAAAAIRVSRSRLYELMDSGEIASVRIGASRRIPRRALVAFVDSLTAGDAA